MHSGQIWDIAWWWLVFGLVVGVFSLVGWLGTTQEIRTRGDPQQQSGIHELHRCTEAMLGIVSTAG